MIGLVPGATATQWVLTRLAARGLATASWFLSSRSNRDVIEETPRAMSDDNLNELGLLGVRAKLTQAPDTDPDSIGTSNHASNH